MLSVQCSTNIIIVCFLIHALARTAYIFIFGLDSVSFRNEFLFAQQTLDVIDIMFIILISCVK